MPFGSNITQPRWKNMRARSIERLANLYLRGIKRDSKDRFKAWCAKRGMTMVEGFEKVIRDLVNQEEQLKDFLK